MLWSPYKKPSLNKLFLYFCLLGAILRSDKVKGKYKKLWLITVVATSSIIITSHFTFVTALSDISLKDTLYLLLPLCILFGFFVSISLKLYFFNDIKNGIDDLDKYEYCGVHSPTEQNENEGYIVHLKEYSFLALIITTLSVKWLIGLAQALFIENVDLNNKLLYLYPFPDYIRVNSVIVYMCISIVQLITATPSLLSLAFNIRLYEAFHSNLDELMTDLQSYLRHHSKRVLQAIEFTHNEELSQRHNPIRRKLMARQRVRKLQTIFHEFDEIIVHGVRQHQKIIK